MTNYQLIESAIKQRKQITCTYNNLYRECCPHAIGLKGTEYHVMMFQFAGESSGGTITPGVNEERRCMELDKVENLQVRDGAWHTSNDHSKPNTCVDQVLVSV